ncbi:MAG: O-antigen ligase family protein [Marinobacter sp. HL-58]|nr:MAG: O-antigen ligase family protein [Marinobacter sp. HL-58]
MNATGISRLSGSWDCKLAWISRFAVASYLVFYVLVPDFYVIGPALLLLMALFGCRWREILGGIDTQSQWLAGVFLLYFLGQAVPLIFHGEDVSEFDLSTRYIAAVLILLFVLKYPLSARGFLSLAAIGSLAAGAYAFYQAQFIGASRVSAFDNPIHYGNGAMALALLSLTGVGWAAKQKYHYCWIGLFLAGVVGGGYASLVSGTRSGWIAVPFIAVIAVYVFWQPIFRKKLISFVLLSLVVVGFSALLQVDMVEKRAQVAVDEFVDYYEEGRNGTSVGLRLDMWKAGMTAFIRNPLIGSGPGGTDAVIAELVADQRIHPAVENFRHLHNQYVDVMARYGLIGLTCYLMLLVVPFILFLQRARSESASVQALALGGSFFVALHAIVNLTQSMLERNIGVMMFAFMVIFIWGAIRAEESAVRNRKDQECFNGSRDVDMD